MSFSKIVETKEGRWEYQYHGNWYDRTLVIESIKRLEDVSYKSIMSKREKRGSNSRV